MSKIVEINCETKEIIERDMNPDELAQHKKDIETNKKETVEKEAKRKAKLVLYEKLGITEEEAKLLLN